MNIKINKKLMSLLLAGAMGFSLCSCAKDDEISTDTFSLGEVVTEVEDTTITDEVLKSNSIDMINPFTGEVRDTYRLIDAATYLENLLTINDKLDLMPDVMVFSPDSENYQFVEDEVKDWSIDYVFELIADATEDDKEFSDLAKMKLSYYKTYLDKELRLNGINIATALLETSIKSDVLDTYGGDVDDISKVKIYGNVVFYEDHKMMFNDRYELGILDSLYNIKNYPEEFNRAVQYDGVVTVLTETLNITKDVIYEDFIKEKDSGRSI